MDREIKFRAWDKRHKKWVTDWVVSSYEHPLDLGAELMDDDIEPLELQQYTGLKDKNGKEIYEGDVCRYFDTMSDSYIIDGVDGDPTIGVVEWCADYCALRLREVVVNHKGGRYWSYWNQCDAIEVIGDIHENPELLK